MAPATRSQTACNGSNPASIKAFPNGPEPPKEIAASSAALKPHALVRVAPTNSNLLRIMTITT